MKVNYTYKYRLYPKNQDKEILEKYFGACRFVYNYFLNERKEQYQKDGKSDNYYKQSKTLTELKKKKEYKWLKEIHSQVLQNSLRNLETAYTNFFQKKAGFPTFKKKKGNNSFKISQYVKYENGKLYIPKYKKEIKVKEHNKLEGKILFATISKTPTNKYYVSITVEKEYISKQPTNKEVGIDLGIKDLVICSNGLRFKNNKFITKYSNNLKKAQQHLSRKKKGSSQFEKQKLKVAKIQEKISNCRKDILHKLTHKLIIDYDNIYLENLNVKNMVKNHKLSKEIIDCSWGELVRQLEYKGKWNNCKIVKIDRFYPSSKTCYNCGFIVDNLPLNIREWNCPKCNTHLDRDINAAINILKEGKRISLGTNDYTNGGDVRQCC